MGETHEVKAGSGQFTPYGRQFFAPLRAMILINKAKSFMDEPDADYGIAAILAQTACEVVFEGFISVKIRQGELKELEKFVDSLRITYTTTNQTAEKLYYTLTGDETFRGSRKDKGISKRLQETAALRHCVVHKGMSAKQAEAQRSIRTAEEFVVYLVESDKRFAREAVLPRGTTEDTALD